LHFVLRKRVLRFPRVKDSSRETKLEMRNGRILRLAIHFFLEAESVFEERRAGIGLAFGCDRDVAEPEVLMNDAVFVRFFERRGYLPADSRPFFSGNKPLAMRWPSVSPGMNSITRK
jgi:hypothetical protein